jgi:ABC-2 type transport system permease protein
MRKYLHVMAIGVQNTLVYRFNYFFRAAMALVPLMGSIFVWRAIYHAKGDGSLVGPFTLARMTTYYLIVTLVDALTAVAEDDWQIAADIKDGAISQFLLKPVDYLAYRVSLYAAGRAAYTSVALVPVAAFFLIQREWLVWPETVSAGALFLLSAILGGMIQFFIAYAMAMLAFWVLDISTFIFIQFAFEYIASGHLFPLDVLPAPLAAALKFTPYPWLCYFPASVWLGEAHGRRLWEGLAIQTAWAVAGFILAKFLWRRGIRKYAAAGG